MPAPWPCRENCGECCGVVPILKKVFARHQEKAQRLVKTVDCGHFTVPITSDSLCTFLSAEKRCMIYPVRPKVCRQYGQVFELPCPYITMEGRVRTPEQAERLKVAINTMVETTRQVLMSRRVER
ncbi:MAG: YkgJ family cysteine cluster protein [Methanomicrobiales archaeon]|nr:YkgJ family cysteine cluster protein [Methanomicrobiales archaeon]